MKQMYDTVFHTCKHLVPPAKPMIVKFMKKIKPETCKVINPKRSLFTLPHNDRVGVQERLRDNGHHRELPRLRLNPSQKQGCQNLLPVRVTVFTRPSDDFHPLE